MDINPNVPPNAKRDVIVQLLKKHLGWIIFLLTKSEQLYNMSDMKENNRVPQLKKLMQKRDLLMEKTSRHKNILRGTIIERGNICGKKNCRCKRKHKPVLHGPYKYLSHRSREKTNMIFLNDEKLIHAVKGVKGYEKLTKLLYEISELNFKILRYHYKKIDIIHEEEKL